MQTIGRGGRNGSAGYAERRDEALRLRMTCGACGAALQLTKAGTGSRPKRCECGGTGASVKGIAAALGVSISTAGGYVADPDRSRANARRAKYVIPCVECGHPLDGGDSRRRRRYRCGWCVDGRPSPTRIATSPTGFRSLDSKTCGVPGCTREKRDGGHVCRECHDAGPYAQIREELDQWKPDRSIGHRRAMTRATRVRKRAGGALGGSGWGPGMLSTFGADPAELVAA